VHRPKCFRDRRPCSEEPSPALPGRDKSLSAFAVATGLASWNPGLKPSS
jgi:hypothetical protein